MTLYQLIQSDYKKHKKYGANLLTIFFLTQGFWAVFQYRIAHYAFVKIKLQPFRIVFFVFALLWQKWIEVSTGIAIPASTKIGHSFYIGHFGGIIINANVIIGDNCNISQGVTIGVSGIDDNRGVPILGNNVYLGANAVVAGKINIGNNVLIAACTLVTMDLNDFDVAIGVPAVVVSDKGSKGYI